MAKTLTAAAVRTLRPTSQRQEIKDAACPGLYLVIQTSGASLGPCASADPIGDPANSFWVRWICPARRSLASRPSACR